MEIEIEEQCADCFLAGAYFSLVDTHAATLVLPNGQGRGCEHAVKHRFSVLVVVNGLLLRTHTHAYGRLVPS